MIVAHVHVVNRDVIMSADGMSYGALDFFAGAPFKLFGSSLRTLVQRVCMLYEMKAWAELRSKC